MHFRSKRQKRNEFKYHFGDDELMDVGFGTFDKMHKTGVMSVSNYTAEIWAYKDFK